jgi:hypothetical protein
MADGPRTPREEPMSDEETTNVPKKKRKKATSPTKRSLAECRKRGWTAQVVERWNSHAFKRIDLFGCIDIVAITPEGIVGIQAASDNAGGGHSDHVKKILAEPRAKAWLAAGARLEVWSWGKRGAASERKLWRLRVEAIEVSRFEESLEQMAEAA